MKFHDSIFVKNSPRNLKFHRNQSRIMNILHGNLCTCIIICCSVRLRMRSVLDMCLRENQNTHFCSIFFLFFKNCAVYEIVWEVIVKLVRPQMTILCMRVVCCLPKTTNTHSEYVTLVALPLQQWIHEHTIIVTLNAH